MKKVKCKRCGAKMEFDGDEAYVCPECGIFALVESDGKVYFNDEDLDYETVGEEVRCNNCGHKMIMFEGGCECPECGNYIPD